MAKKSKSSLPKKLFGGGDKKYNPAVPGIFNMRQRMEGAANVLSKGAVPGMKKGGSTKSRKK
jgi:hypothetical protein